MPQPTLQDVHVNRPLTNISVAYLQEAAGVEFVADKAFPAVPVENKSDLYYTYARADFNRDEMQKRALSAESAGTGYNLNSTGTYNCDVWSLHKDVDDQIRSNSDSPLAPDRDATIFLTQKALIRRENQWVSKFFGTGIWTNQASGHRPVHFAQRHHAASHLDAARVQCRNDQHSDLQRHQLPYWRQRQAIRVDGGVLGKQLPARLLSWLGSAGWLPDPRAFRVGRSGLRGAVRGARPSRIDRVRDLD